MVDLSRILRRPQQQARRVYDKPARERHFLSIICSVLSSIFLIMALALKVWASGDNNECSFVFGLTTVYIVHSSNQHSETIAMATYYTIPQQILIACILSVTALTLFSSLVATIISAGYPREKLEFIRHYAVFNIVSLLCIVLVAGLWLAVVETLPSSKYNRCGEGGNYQFGYAFYILLVGGLFSLGAAAFNLLCARSAADRRRSLRLRFREQQLRNRQLTESEGDSSGTESRMTTITRSSRRRGVAPPVYSLIDTGSELTTDSEFETEAETSLSEPEYTEHEPDLSPPPYSP